MELKIVRNRWLRGEGSEESYLLRRRDKKQCCVGFYALALGLKEEDIVGHKVLRDIVSVPAAQNPIWPGEMARLYHDNDDENITDTAREAKIKDIFARHNVEVEFI